MYSECCTAPPHHIFDELCGECMEHCEFHEEEEYDADIEDLQNY